MVATNSHPVKTFWIKEKAFLDLLGTEHRPHALSFCPHTIKTKLKTAASEEDKHRPIKHVCV